MAWEPGPGVVELPDGARLRGRGLRGDVVPEPPPEWALYLLGRPPRKSPWPGRWLRWPDLGLPASDAAAQAAFAEAHRRALAGQRVEIACAGGRGRTGTALACIAQLGGVPAAEAVEWVRERYDRRAAQTPWQRRYARRFSAWSSSPRHAASTWSRTSSKP